MIGFLRRYASGYGMRLVALVALTLAQGAIQLFGLTREMKSIVDDGIGAQDMARLTESGLRMLLFTALVAACGAAVAYVGSSVACGIRKDITRDCYHKILSLSSVDVARFGEATLITRTITDTENIQRLLAFVLGSCLLAPVTMVLMLASLVTGDFDVFVLEVVAVVVSIALMLVLMMRSRRRFPELQASLDALNLLTKEKVDGMRTIRAFGREDAETGRGKAADHRAFRADVSANRPLKFVSPSILTIMNLSMAAVYWIGAAKVESGLVELSTLLLTIQYVNSLIPSLSAMPIVVNMIPGADVAVARISELLDHPETVSGGRPSAEAPKPSTDAPALELAGVSFAFEDHDATLTDLNLTIRRGARVGVVGATGSGKSTLLALLCGLYRPQGGRVLVGGVPMEDLDETTRMATFSFVPQKAMVFQDGVRENIRAYHDEIGDEAIDAAVRASVFDEVVSVLEDGLDTKMAQGGMNLSGGQRKRLALARGLAKDAEVYVLDDPFAALDAVTERKARERTLEALAGKTVVMSTQRFATIVDFDQIVCLRQGRIEDVGTHEELLGRCREYADMYRTQTYLESR